MLSLLSAELNLQNKVTIVAMKLSRHDEFAQRQAASLHLFDVIGRSIKERVSTEQVAAPPAWLPRQGKQAQALLHSLAGDIGAWTWRCILLL